VCMRERAMAQSKHAVNLFHKLFFRRGKAPSTKGGNYPPFPLLTHSSLAYYHLLPHSPLLQRRGRGRRRQRRTLSKGGRPSSPPNFLICLRSLTLCVENRFADCQRVQAHARSRPQKGGQGPGGGVGVDDVLRADTPGKLTSPRRASETSWREEEGERGEERQREERDAPASEEEALGERREREWGNASKAQPRHAQPHRSRCPPKRVRLPSRPTLVGMNRPSRGKTTGGKASGRPPSRARASWECRPTP